MVIAASQSGTMDETLMIDYTNRVLLPNKSAKSRALLIMDSHRAHFTEKVNEFFEKHGIVPLVIPGGYTSSVQPLDVCINKTLKDSYKALWHNWFVDAKMIQMKNGGNRQKPPYEMVAKWISQFFEKIDKPILIQRAFTCCGLYDGNSQFVSGLNCRIKSLLLVTDPNYNRDIYLTRLAIHKYPLINNLLDDKRV